jgi:hypothetical protein
MTTHDMQPEMADPTVRADRPVEPPVEVQSSEPPLETVDATPDFEAPVEQPVEQPVEAASTQPAQPAEAAPAAAPDTDQVLFADGELTDMRSRWTEVQSAFVDDPRDCVQKADSLVADVVDRLTAGFSQARSGLEEQWSRGEEVSTEELRIALKRYREFFERLLAV